MICSLILTIFGEVDQPLRFRQIEAHVVLKGVDVSTFEVHLAVRRLVEIGTLVEDDLFCYRLKKETEP